MICILSFIRLKEEERRKELARMRDEARAARMVALQVDSFFFYVKQHLTLLCCIVLEEYI